MKKGKIFFNIIIIITIIALISAISYVAYYYISNYIELKRAEQAVDEFENDIIVVGIEEDNQIQENIAINETIEQQTTNNNKPSKSYKGYSMIGSIQIPKTKIKSPIVDKVTPNSISAAVATLYGPGLNEVGNTVLVAHNYRNR